MDESTALTTTRTGRKAEHQLQEPGAILNSLTLIGSLHLYSTNFMLNDEFY